MDRDDLRAELEMNDVVTIELDDGYSYSAGVASNWIGGSDTGFMSDLLGNVEYSTVSSLVEAVFNFLSETGRQIAEIR